MDFKSEISKLEKQVTDLKAASHDQQNVVAQAQGYFQGEQNRLAQIEINLKAAQTTLDYIRQLEAEAEQAAQKEAEAEKAEAAKKAEETQPKE